MLLSKLCLAARSTVIEAQFPPKWTSRRLTPGYQSDLLAPARGSAPRTPARNIFGLVPTNQYENNIRPKKFQLGYAMLHHWEIIPLVLVIAFEIVVLLGIALYVAFNHKVDTQWSKHNWNCISRNMDLHNPTIHKLVVLFERYDPWPEMQNVLDKMTEEERRRLTRMEACRTP